MVTGPRPGVVRAGSIPAEQAAMLRGIQHLAVEGARLREQMHAHADNLQEMSRILHDANTIDRDRVLAEIAARTAGIPAVWVDHVRERGRMGQAWDDRQMLPTPPAGRRRRSERTIADDTGQLTDMAAVTVVRDHLMALDGVDKDPEPIRAQQFHRNMAALTSRMLLVARAIGMTSQERSALWDTPPDWQHHIGHYLHHYRRDDVDTLWRRYANPDIAARARASQVGWRRTMRKHPPPPTPSNEVRPPPPNYLLRQARDALCTLTATPPAPGTDTTISAAVDTLLPDTDHHRGWTPVSEDRHDAAPAPREPGADREP
ncbi:hypothetical protein [Nocardia blacklockiae]|uniref:hypothetical protein n=1 Tax=Nocardia blacklockiae TaxID=480036 RepID=UPI00189384EB|nr:hypothetical protein [Nocardia blacklockiae]MBF6176039.1 hypothetical protein [Nocardia blacklockiae]